MSDRETDTDALAGIAISEDLVRAPDYKIATTGEEDFGGLLQNPVLKLHQDLAKGNGIAGDSIVRFLIGNFLTASL